MRSNKSKWQIKTSGYLAPVSLYRRQACSFDGGCLDVWSEVGERERSGLKPMHGSLCTKGIHQVSFPPSKRHK